MDTDYHRYSLYTRDGVLALLQGDSNKRDTSFVLKNSLDLPRTVLRPITSSIGDSYPDEVAKLVKLVSELLSTHRFGEEIHAISP